MSGEPVNSRLETFCDGVFAIALTLLILEIKVPPAEKVHNAGDLWRELSHLLPSLYAFLLSFGIILISWVNHHSLMKLVDRSSPVFIYANGFLLLTIVVLPFPTELLSEYGFTNAGGPAVMIYSFVNMLNNIGWLWVCHSILHPKSLAKNKASVSAVKKIMQRGRYGMLFYITSIIVAYWFPVAIAVVLTLLWISWLLFGIKEMKAKEEEV